MNKLVSRKFVVTLGTLLLVLQDKSLSTTQLIVIGAVSCVYIIAEALIDHQAADIGRPQATRVAKKETPARAPAARANTIIPPPPGYMRNIPSGTLVAAPATESEAKS